MEKGETEDRETEGVSYFQLNILTYIKGLLRIPSSNPWKVGGRVQSLRFSSYFQ